MASNTHPDDLTIGDKVVLSYLWEDLPLRIYDQLTGEVGHQATYGPYLVHTVGVVARIHDLRNDAAYLPDADTIRFDVEFVTDGAAFDHLDVEDLIGVNPLLVAGLQAKDLLPVPDTGSVVPVAGSLWKVKGDVEKIDEFYRPNEGDPGHGLFGADQITKVYLVGRKSPVLVQGEYGDLVNRLLDPEDLARESAPISWPIVRQDGMLSGDSVAFNPAHVVSVTSDVTGSD